MEGDQAKQSRKEALKQQKREQRKVQKQKAVEEEGQEWKKFEGKTNKQREEKKKTTRQLNEERKETQHKKKQEAKQENVRDPLATKRSKPEPAKAPAKCFLEDNPGKTIDDWKTLGEAEKEVTLPNLFKIIMLPKFIIVC
jgi:cell division protein FtsN